VIKPWCHGPRGYKLPKLTGAVCVNVVNGATDILQLPTDISFRSTAGGDMAVTNVLKNKRN